MLTPGSFTFTTIGPLVQPVRDDGDHPIDSTFGHELRVEEIRRDPSGTIIIQPIAKG